MTDRSPARRGALPAAFWYLWSGTLINRIGTFVLPFLTLFLTGQRGLTVARATSLVALYGGSQLAGNLWGGQLADRVGRRATLLLSLFGGAAVMLVTPLMRAYIPLALAVIGLGFLGGLYRPAVGAAVADLVPQPDRAHAYALLYWATNLGAAAAPVLAGLLAQRSFTALFVVDAATSAAYAALALARVPETRPRAAAGAAAIPVAAPGARGAAPARSGWRVALGDAPLMLFAGSSFLLGCIAIQGITTLPLSMSAHGLSARDYGLAIATNGTLVVLLSLPVARWAARPPAGVVLALGAVLGGLGFGLVPLAASTAAYAGTVALWTLGEIVMVPVSGAFTARLAPLELRGTYQGVYAAAWGLAALVGPAAGGMLYERAGEPVLWATCLVVGFVAAAGFLGLTRMPERLPSPA